MKNSNYNIIKNRFQLKGVDIYLLGLILSLTTLFSCTQEDLIIPNVVDNDLELTVSNESLILDQKQASETVDFSWTAGSNKGTGASIEYTLQIDKKGNNFSKAFASYIGKAIYSKSFTYEMFNDTILNRWSGTPGEEIVIESRIIAKVNSSEAEPDTSATAEIAIIPYQPVTKQLFIIGSATEVDWDITNAIEMTPDSQDPTIFTFSGNLSTGTFKFPVNRNTDWSQDMYMKDPGDSTKIYLHKGGDSDDSQWTIGEAGPYLITVSLLDLTFDIEKLEGPTFENIYIVGDGCESGWDIDNPAAFIQSASDPFVFIYEGLLTEGSLKFLAGVTGDWCGEWYRPLNDSEPITSTEVEQNSGCDVDNKWAVTTETAGYYKIVLDTKSVSVKFERIKLYMIGDAGPNGWNIGTPTPMNTNDDGIYTYSGPLTAGELKFSMYKGDWCDGDWLCSITPDQAITDGSYFVRHGCDGDDNKWRVTDAAAGNYDITINLNTKVISIVKQ